MKVFTRDELIKGVVDHPYDSNPSLLAKVNFFYFSKDRKMTVAYYESPVGWFDVEINGFDEIDFILEGEVELIAEGKTLTARPGDCFLIQDGDKFRWRMTKYSKMLFFIYPLNEQIGDLIARFYKRAGDLTT